MSMKLPFLFESSNVTSNFSRSRSPILMGLAKLEVTKNLILAGAEIPSKLARDLDPLGADPNDRNWVLLECVLLPILEAESFVGLGRHARNGLIPSVCESQQGRPWVLIPGDRPGCYLSILLPHPFAVGPGLWPGTTSLDLASSPLCPRPPSPSALVFNTSVKNFLFWIVINSVIIHTIFSHIISLSHHHHAYCFFILKKTFAGQRRSQSDQILQLSSESGKENGWIKKVRCAQQYFVYPGKKRFS